MSELLLEEFGEDDGIGLARGERAVEKKRIENAVNLSKRINCKQVKQTKSRLNHPVNLKASGCHNGQHSRRSEVHERGMHNSVYAAKHKGSTEGSSWRKKHGFALLPSHCLA